MHRILSKLNGKLNSKHYDTYWLQERVNRVHQPVTNKLDKLLDVNMKYESSSGNRTGPFTNQLQGRA